jgi:AraC-like DNA-binding protein
MSPPPSPPPSAAAPALAEPITLPGAYALQLVELVSRWKVGAEELLQGTGLSADTLGDPSTRLTIPVVRQVLARAHALTGERNLAPALGTQMRLSWHGFLGFAALSASTVREAIALGERFAATRTTGLSLRLHESGQTASLIIEARFGDEEVRRFVSLLLVVGLAEIAQTITGEPVSGTADVDFPLPPDLDLRRPAGTLRVEQPTTRLCFPATFLDRPLAMADPVATRLAREQCERELSALGTVGGTEARVRGAVGELFSPTTVPSVEEVAKRLGLSTRTLKRQLAAVGTTYSTLLDDFRKERAMTLLDRRELTLDAVAAELGYSDLANFTRAFKRWTGKTPSVVRRGESRKITG